MKKALIEAKNQRKTLQRAKKSQGLLTSRTRQTLGSLIRHRSSTASQTNRRTLLDSEVMIATKLT
jgi:hypothetical protein